jgi:hypothetical protein
VLDKLFPQLAKEIRAKMEKELKGWPVDPATLTADPNKPAAGAKEATKPESNQGAVGSSKGE